MTLEELRDDLGEMHPDAASVSAGLALALLDCIEAADELRRLVAELESDDSSWTKEQSVYVQAAILDTKRAALERMLEER